MAPKEKDKVEDWKVDQVCEFTSVSRDDARSAIKTMDYDVTRAVDYILNGEFEAEKATIQSNNPVTRAAKGMLGLVNSHYTRSRSPLKNRKSSPAPVEVINVSEDDEDEQLKLAVQMSLADSGPPSRGHSPALPNRSRSIERSPYFGPPRQSDYHEGSWGLVKSSVSAGGGVQETGTVDANGGGRDRWNYTSGEYESVYRTVGPEERKRQEGAPTVLDTRGSGGTWNTDSVSVFAGLMTILHKIPKAREAFLLACPRDPGSEDGPGENWWKGNQNGATMEGVEGVDITGEFILREAARVMAFLDDTDRAYGRLSEYLVKALQNDITKVPRREESADTDLLPPTFLLRWSYIASSNLQRTYLTSPPSTVFDSEICQPANKTSGELRRSVTEIQIDVPRELSDDGHQTILDALEKTIHYGVQPACIRTFSQVLLLRFKREDREGGVGVEILPTLSMARFAYENYDEMVGKVRMREGVKETLEKLRRRQEELTWIERAGKKFNAVQVLETTISYVESMEGNTMSESVLSDDEEPSSRMEIDSETAKLPGISTQLKDSLQLLQQQLQEIDVSTRNMEDALINLFDFPDYITHPSSDPSTPPTRISLVYLLRGVIVDQQITFFSEWTHLTNPYKRKLQWYKSDFSTSKPEIQQIEEGEVLTIARERGSSDGITTIYIRDDVPEIIEKVLPPDYLREYIQKDNEVFQKELNHPIIQVMEVEEEEGMEEASAPPATPEMKPVRKNLNPFLDVQETSEEVESSESAESMLLDDPLPVPAVVVETNPFRRASWESSEMSSKVAEDGVGSLI